jgi:hypothetical protein
MEASVRFTRAFCGAVSGLTTDKQIFTYEAADGMPEPGDDKALGMALVLGNCQVVEFRCVPCTGIVVDERGMHYHYSDGSAYLVPNRQGYWEKLADDGPPAKKDVPA